MESLVPRCVRPEHDPIRSCVVGDPQFRDKHSRVGRVARRRQPIGLYAEPVQSDEALMLAYRAGDSASFGELFQRYAPLLTRVLRRFPFGEDQLADLVQQTFLQLHRARHDFAEGAELRPWLMTIAFNLAREQLRKIKRRPEGEFDVAAENHSARPAREQRQVELRHDLARAVERLPDDQKAVVRLHFVDELSFEEIGEQLGASPGAVRVRAHRGYAALRKILTDGNDLDDSDILKGRGP